METKTPAYRKALAMVPAGMPVGGRWVEAASGATMPVIDPGTEEVLAEVPDGTPADGALAMDAAAGAQATWAATGPRERGEILRRAFELMTERADELALLITLENGKPLSEARAEVLYAAEFFRWFGEEAVRVHGRYMRAPAGAARLLVAKQPVGPCLLITPWNFPAAMATRKIGPAVAAGCTMVLKPAGETPLTALATAALLEEAGLPGGVLSVVTTSRSGALTKPLFADPRLRKVSFTGSTEVGRLLLHHAADQVLRTSMELGGNAPFLVFEDADLDAAVGGALLAKMRNVGEACTSANRFYVAAPVAEEFAGRLGERMGDMRVGHGAEPGTEVGPLINEAGRAKVEELVTDMVSRGARVVVGGAPIEGRGYFYRPTVVADVAEGSRALSEEIFGPVAPVISFTDEASAVAWANRTEYGLVAYLYTRDVGRAFRVAEALEAGMVGLNTGLVSNPAAPFGGVKQSGLGREGGFEGVEEFLETKYISVNW